MMIHIVSWNLTNSIELVAQAVIVASVAIFLFVSMKEGEILQVIPRFTWRWAWWIRKPLHGCCKCMAFWYGLAIVLLFGGNILTPLVAAGFVSLIEKHLEDGD